MSMLSSRCDRLREIADHLESDPSTQYTAPEVRYAADTIWELRCKLAGVVDQREEVERLEDENAKLQEERDLYRELFNLTTQPDRYVQVRDENAKLREYAKAYLASVRFSCEPCPYCAQDSCEPETLPLRDGCRLYEEMREMGIEVE